MPSVIESPFDGMQKRPQDGISWEQKVAVVEKFFLDPSEGSGIYVNIQEEDLGQGVTEGPTR